MQQKKKENVQEYIKILALSDDGLSEKSRYFYTLSKNQVEEKIKLLSDEGWLKRI